jgi:hypothetical protein
LFVLIFLICVQGAFAVCTFDRELL